MVMFLDESGTMPWMSTIFRLCQKSGRKCCSRHIKITWLLLLCDSNLDTVNRGTPAILAFMNETEKLKSISKEPRQEHEELCLANLECKYYQEMSKWLTSTDMETCFPWQWLEATRSPKSLYGPGPLKGRKTQDHGKEVIWKENRSEICFCALGSDVAWTIKENGTVNMKTVMWN